MVRVLFRCASISWIEVVTKRVSNWLFSSSEYRIGRFGEIFREICWHWHGHRFDQNDFIFLQPVWACFFLKCLIHQGRYTISRMPWGGRNQAFMNQHIRLGIVTNTYWGKTTQNSSYRPIQVTDYRQLLRSQLCSLSRNCTGERTPSRNWSFTGLRSRSGKTLTGVR